MTRPRTVVAITPAAGLALAAAGGSALDGWPDRVDAIALIDAAPSAVSGADRGPDAALVAAALIAAYPHAAWIVGADVARDYPYNLARRVASLASLASTGVGVLLGSAPSALPGAADADPAALAADAALVLQKLWQSWPAESVIADRDGRRFVDASRIRRVDHEGLFSVAGPLQLPVRTDDQPVVVQPEGPGTDAADVIVTRSPRPSADPRPRLLTVDAAALLRHDDGHDVLVHGPAELIAEVVAERAERDWLPAGRRGPLRTRLGIAPTPARPLSAHVAFPSEKW